MFTEANEKLQQTRDLLVELIAEIDVVLEDERLAHRGNSGRDGHDGIAGHDGDPPHVRRLARQRELVLTVASVLADMRFETGRETQRHDG